MGSAGRTILDLIEEIGGASLARRAGKACAGRRLNLSAAALRRDRHPLRRLLGAKMTARLIERLGDGEPRRRVVRFPEVGASDYLRRQRERASFIRRMILAGDTVLATAQAAKVHSRTVGYHRARMRAEGLLPERVGA